MSGKESYILKRIAIDMDEVMVNVLDKQILTFNGLNNTKLTREELTGTNLFKLYPERHSQIYEFINDPGFFRDLPMMDDCRETILELSQHYEIIIATAAMEVPNSFEAKYEWLKKNFDFLNDQHFVFCGNKSVIQADYLIDDNLYQLQSFKNKGILFTAPHNIHLDYDLRVNNWQEVKDYFLPALVKE